MSVITISRMYGAGGSDVAAHVAGALGWPLYDNDVVDRVSARLGVTLAEVKERDERIPSMAERIATTMTMSAPEMMPPMPRRPTPTQEQLVLEATRRVIEDAVQQGPGVFVGRGAQSLLAARPDALHVFCYAPKEFLTRFVVEHRQVAPHDAERTVAETNKQREAYVKRNFHRNWLDFANYHLCLNTGWLGIIGAAELVVEAARRKGIAG